MKKIVILMIASLVMVGCGRNAPTLEEFSKKADKIKYTSIDVTKDQIRQNIEIKSMHIFSSDDKKTIMEFIVFDDIEKSKEFYKVFQVFFEEDKEKIVSAKENKDNKYARTNIKTKEQYFVFAYLDNTVIYAITAIDNSRSLDKDIRKLGY